MLQRRSRLRICLIEYERKETKIKAGGGNEGGNESGEKRAEKRCNREGLIASSISRAMHLTGEQRGANAPHYRVHKACETGYAYLRTFP